MNCCSYIARIGERMMSMNSTLVETVSINYEDFNESFLTCGTCLCMYDGGEHTPKLLQCSHTVCLHCLSRIAASQTRDTGAFRCPICRELIPIPRGGVSALPPSFLVNQLLDLMSRQRREVIPKCSVHINQELLFCETCDTVFCTQCTATNGGFSAGVHGASASSSNGSCEHTVIPFSIAIKRMSEILLYKANECISKLGLAQETVSDELRKLNQCAERCVEYANHTFDEVIRLAEERRQEVISFIGRVQASKRCVLEEQLALVEAEKNKVEHECDGLQYQVEVRNITQKISSLSEKLDTVGALGEPRENAFLACEFKLSGYTNPADFQLTGDDTNTSELSLNQGDRETSLDQLRDLLSNFGRVRTSTTFPGLCSLVLDNPRAGQGNGQEGGAAAPVVACLEVVATLYTVDYHGIPRTTGGDPLTAELVIEMCEENGESERVRQLDVRIADVGDGTYLLIFRPPVAGTYSLRVNVLDRPIRDFPFHFEATEHNNPLRVFGCRGSGKDGFHQPVAVAVDDSGNTPGSGLVYVVDAGNSRIKVLTADLDFVRHIECEDLAGRSCTGVALARKSEDTKGENGKWSPCNLVLVNWRSKVISEITAEGETVRSFSYPSFVEPVAVAVDSRGHILVADNGTASVVAFDPEGKVLFVIGGGNKSEEGEKVSTSRSQGASAVNRVSHGHRSGASSTGVVGKGKGHFGLISSVAIGPGDEIIVSDSRVQIFSSSGEYLRDVEGHGRGRYGAATVDPQGRLIVIHSDKARHELQVISLAKERNGTIARSISKDPLLSTVDSHGSRLRRPSGVAVTKDCHAFVVDLGNDCVKKYQYW